MRYSPEVVAYFKATGKGWQARMDEALREWIARRLTLGTHVAFASVLYLGGATLFGYKPDLVSW